MNRPLVLLKRGTAFVGIFAVLLAVALALPARTVTSAYVNDVLIFLDGANRIAFGQVPNRDFHTALGPLVYYIPAIGFWLSGRMGGALPVGMGVLILLLTPVFMHVLGSRLRPMLALPFGAFLLLILAIPANLGDPLSSISFAMYYNRIGWAVLALLAVMYLHPLDRTKTHWWWDAVCAAILVLVALYTKITYAPAAFAVLLLIALDGAQRRWAGAALGLVGCGMFLVELVWRGSFAHVQDLLATAKVSGERNLLLFVQVALNNFYDLAVAGLLAGLAVLRTRRLLDLLFYGLCFGSGMLIISQNAHAWGMITLFAASVVAAETSLREASTRYARAPGWSGEPLLFWLLVLPPLGKHALAMAIYVYLAASNFGTPLALPNFADVRFGRLWSPGDHGFTELYIGNFAKAAELLGQMDDPERVLVLDFANPVSAGMGLVPPRGDISWMHWGRNLDAEHHPAPQELFADVAVVMIPKIGINSMQLEELYGPYIAERYALVSDTAGWKVYRVRNSP